MDMIRSRNLTSHTYNEETADKITEAITARYFAAFEELQQRFTELEALSP
jgi:hypothetical protein